MAYFNPLPDQRIKFLYSALAEHIPSEVFAEVEQGLVPGQSLDYYLGVLSGLDTAYNLMGGITPPGATQKFTAEQHMLYRVLMH